MKKILLLLTLVASFAIVQPVRAATTFCDGSIDDLTEYNVCCASYTSENSAACSAYAGTIVTRSDQEAEIYCKNLSAIGTKSDYDVCCTQNWGLQLYNICDAWAGGGGAVPGTVNSSTQNVNPVYTNGAGVSGSVLPGTSTVSTASQQCSAIAFKTLLDMLVWVKCIIGAFVIPLIFTLAFLFFMWNILTFMRSSDKTNKEEAKTRMGWGIIALVVMLGIWGIVAIISNTFGLTPTVPLLQTESLQKTPTTQKAK